MHALQKKTKVLCWFLRFTHNVSDPLDGVFLTEESRIHLAGYINLQSYQIWSKDNQHAHIENGLYPQKVDTWCAISRTRVVRPIFFEDTITAAWYHTLSGISSHLWRKMNVSVIFNKMARQPIEPLKLWHSRKNFLMIRVISNGIWPAQSTDLTFPNFFFKNPPRSLPDLRCAVQDQINLTDEQMLKNVFCNMLPHVLFVIFFR